MPKTTKNTVKTSKYKTKLADQFGYSQYLTQSSGEVAYTYEELRNLANANPFVAIAINKIKQKAARAEWVVKPKNKESKGLESLIEYATDLLKTPNQQDDTYTTLLKKTLDDLLTIDQGIWEKVRNQRGEVMEIYHVDGATIQEKRDDYGYFLDTAYLQFLPNNVGGIPDAVFAKDDIMKFQANPQINKNGRGKSPVELVLLSVVSGIRALQYNTSVFTNSAIPDSMINLKGVSTDEVVAFKSAFEAQLKGNYHANAYTNAEAIDIKLLRPSNQEMQFYELNLWLARIVISAFDMSPQEFGLTMDVNRSTAEQQAEVSKEGGLSTYLDLIEEEINVDLIGDLATIDKRFNEIEFKYVKAKDLIELKTQAEIDTMQINSGTRSTDELRLRDGLDPMPKSIEPVDAVQKSKLYQFYG